MYDLLQKCFDVQPGIFIIRSRSFVNKVSLAPEPLACIAKYYICGKILQNIAGCLKITGQEDYNCCMRKKILVAVVGILSFLYLLNPGLGIFELIPDNVPLIGNLDEATATFLLLSSLAYFGIDLRDIFTKSDTIDKSI